MKKFLTITTVLMTFLIISVSSVFAAQQASIEDVVIGDKLDKKLTVVKGEVSSGNDYISVLDTVGNTSGSLKIAVATKSSVTIEVKDDEENVLATKAVSATAMKLISVDFTLKNTKNITLVISGEGTYNILPLSSLN